MPCLDTVTRPPTRPPTPLTSLRALLCFSHWNIPKALVCVLHSCVCEQNHVQYVGFVPSSVHQAGAGVCRSVCELWLCIRLTNYIWIMSANRRNLQDDGIIWGETILKVKTTVQLSAKKFAYPCCKRSDDSQMFGSGLVRDASSIGFGLREKTGSWWMNQNCYKCGFLFYSSRRHL